MARRPLRRRAWTLRRVDRPFGDAQSAGLRAGVLGALRADDFERLLNHGIALRFDLVALFYAEGLVEELGFQAIGDEVALGGPVAYGGLDAAFRREHLKCGQDLRRHLEI